MKRVIIIGSPGSGKTTLARVLAAKYQLPLVQLDHLYWLPGRVRRPYQEFHELAMAAARQEAWIMDGTAIKQLAERLPYADTVIFLDIPRRTCFWRILKRGIRALFTKQEFAPGCREVLSWEFLCWTWRWHQDRRSFALHALVGHPNVLTLTSPAAVDAFLAKL